MYSDIMQLPLQRREAEFDGANKENRLVHFSFSSEAEVQKPFGIEILSHRQDAIDTERLDQGVVPLLYNHDFERSIGQVISYRIGTTKAYGTAKLNTTPLAEQTLQDMRSGTRPSISVGYLPKKMVLLKSGEGDEQNRYLVTRWSVLEVSSVSVPADPYTGLNRAFPEKLHECRVMSFGSRGITAEEEQAILDEMRLEWLEEQELERLKVIEAQAAKLQYYLF
jgi:HK97 family phage prohead protease